METDCFVVNLGRLSHKSPNNDFSVDTETVAKSSSRSTAECARQRCGIGRRKKRDEMPKATERTQKEVVFKSSSNEFSCLTVDNCESEDNATQDNRWVSLNASENNSTTTDLTRTCPSDKCGAPPEGGARIKNIRGTGRPPVKTCPGGCHQGLVNDPDARALMNCCMQNTVEQVTQMHVKGADCKSENPYAALRTDTFKKLIKTSRRRAGNAKKPGKKIKWCRPKADECDDIKLQLCPNLGEGHTHEKLIAEVTPMLMRTAQSLDCQLREVCRRLFFMKHNVPQMTAPALVNFHAILARITHMLMTDFASFPSGLRLPSRKES